MHRLFIALRPPAPMRAQLLSLMHGIPGARWQDDAQLHLTLRFLGEVEGGVAEDVATVLDAVRGPALMLALAGVGRFDTRGRANAVWAGVAPRDGVTHLHHKIDRAMVRIGLAPERRAFLPHITLARLNGACGPVEPFLAANAGLAGPSMQFDAFGLYESHLGSDGASYRLVARYPLGERQAVVSRP